MSSPFTNSFAKSLYSNSRKTSDPPPTGTTPKATKGPTTPVSQYPSPLPKTPISAEHTPTGKWSHPAISKVTQLESRKAPNDTTIRRIIYNTIALLGFYKCVPYIHGFSRLNNLVGEYYIQWTVYAVYSLLIYNIFENARRFWWTNTFEDPTLTDTQRKLLNLPISPASAKSSPAPITPPRYQKAFTPSQSTQSSPLSGNSGRRSSYSAYSPSNPSEAQKASILPLDRNSPGAVKSPSGRAVSMLVPPQASALRNSAASPASLLSTSMSSSVGSKSTEFGGSTRWKYTQNNALDSPRSSFY